MGPRGDLLQASELTAAERSSGRLPAGGEHLPPLLRPIHLELARGNFGSIPPSDIELPQFHVAVPGFVTQLLRQQMVFAEGPATAEALAAPPVFENPPDIRRTPKRLEPRPKEKPIAPELESLYSEIEQKMQTSGRPGASWPLWIAIVLMLVIAAMMAIFLARTSKSSSLLPAPQYGHEAGMRGRG